MYPDEPRRKLCASSGWKLAAHVSFCGIARGAPAGADPESSLGVPEHAIFVGFEPQSAGSPVDRVD
jgi:hypothetical protein